MNTEPTAGSYANAVNNKGQVVGLSSIGNPASTFYATHAFLSDPNGGALHDLGSLSSGSSGANGINDAGDVVGYYNDFNISHGQHAFLFTNGTMLDLNTLIVSGSGYATSGFTMTTAKGISNSGFITGIGTSADGSTHAFLLTPEAVPEASTTVSLGLLLVLGGLAVAVRKKRGRVSF